MSSTIADASERWQRIASLFEAALEKGDAERARYIEIACADDPALKTEIEGLLARALTPSFLDDGALTFAAPLLRGDSSDTGVTFDITGSIDEAAGHLGDRTPQLEHETEATEEGVSHGYVMERKLARGGSATVYLARDVKHDRLVAVKVLDAALRNHVGAKRFVQEIRLTARLQHPHVLGLIDSGICEVGPLAGRPYYVMPFVAGESLRSRLARGHMGMAEALRVMREVADALAYSHGQGVIHCDIKPENILLSGDHAVVADFGIAKALAASEATAEPNEAARSPSRRRAMRSGLIGTPAYMAPEQAAAGSAVDHRADLYAWGVVAYELLAGRHPFGRQASAHEMLAAHAGERPRPLQEIAPSVSADIAALVMRCLEKLPADRPASAAQIAAALDATPPAALTNRFALSPRRLAWAFGSFLIAAGLASNANRAHRASLVIATGNPIEDVRAIQAAVDRGGEVTLQGHFSFATPPTKPLAPMLASGWYAPAAEVLISKAVNISGVRDARGEMATIESGTIPFYVDAPGNPVRIRGLRFVRPAGAAILVRAVRGLEISRSKFDGLRTQPVGALAISIDTHGSMPTPTSPGNPEDVSGEILIAHNEIDASGGSALAYTSGVFVFSVGRSPNEAVDLLIIGNDISNSTSSAVNIRHVAGRARVIDNTLRTSAETPGGVDALRVVDAGPVLITNNTVECKWPNAGGIQVFSPFPEWPTQRATVEDNDVHMSPPAGVELGDYSAGIGISGYTDNVIVRGNRISGRARAALAIYSFRGGRPTDNAFIDNRLDRFQSTIADIFIGSGVSGSHIVGPGSISDHGTRTIRER